MIQLTNPIPERIKDPRELGELIEKYQIVPYFGDTNESSHSLMYLIRDLSQLSPSHIACKEDIGTYAFSSEVSLVNKPIPGLKMDLVDISEQEAIRRIESLQNIGIDLPTIISLTRDLDSNYKDAGNTYLHIKIVTVGGTTRVMMDNIHYTNAAYLATSTMEDRILILTERWDEDWWRIKPPTIVPASYPGRPFNWKKSGGTWETVVHIKNKPPKTSWYGLPPTLSVLYWMFVEFSQSDLATKISNTEFVTKKIIAFEEVNPTRMRGGDEDRSDDFAKKMRVLRSLTTNEGGFTDVHSLAGIEYPFEGKPPTTIDLEINRDTTYTDWVLGKASQYVYAMHGWYPQLTGMHDMKANIGGNIVIDLFNMANVSTVIPLQIRWRNIWASILSEIGVITGQEIDWTINFDNLIGQLLENLDTTSSALTATEDVEDDPDDQQNSNEDGNVDDDPNAE